MSLNDQMTALADAVRESTGVQGKLSISEMALALAGIDPEGTLARHVDDKKIYFIDYDGTILDF